MTLRLHYGTMWTIFENAMRKKYFYLIKVIIPGNVKMDCDCCILTLFETIFFNRKEIFENKDDKWCILPLLDTIFWNAEKMLKAMKQNGAFWRFLSPMLDEFKWSASATPNTLHFLMQIWTFYLSHFLRWSVGPGLMGL